MTTLVIGGTDGIGAQVVADLRADGDDVRAPSMANLNVTSSRNIEQAFRDDDIDRVVYSAGINMIMPLGKIGFGMIEDIFDVNIIGFIKVMDAVARTSRVRSVVAIVSDSAHIPMRHSIVYASSKAALAHAVRCAARELAPRVRVNGVSPSTVDGTRMTSDIDVQVPRSRGWTPEEASRYELSLVPMGRRCDLEEVSALVRSVLAGPEFLTGAVIPLTGGK